MSPTPQQDLVTALREGDPQKVQSLIEAGADVLYKSVGGYDALINALHGRDVARDPRLLELLSLLVGHGVHLSGISEYSESGLRVLSHIGRFDGVRLLLEAGADKSQLGWTPLMEAVAFGSLADVQVALDQNPSLEDTDWWSRTAWLIALLTGDIDKASLLRERGANLSARGRCGCPPVFYAIQGHHPEMLRWLIREGLYLNSTDKFGETALMQAVEANDLECVKILLEARVDITVDTHGTALKKAESREIIMRLLDAGADPADADQRLILGLRETPDEVFATITPDEFSQSCMRRFGESNPERMTSPFWEAMIRSGVNAYAARERFEVEIYTIDEPVWSADRFGQSLTLLDDGRAIQIGGEHEDYGDPDFCIYNDVFVHETDGSITIYGYPESVFPPTDFHTATLVADSIYVIGSLGYLGSRGYEFTPVYRLNIHTLRMERLETGGESPGWIHRHRAEAMGNRAIRVWDGNILKNNAKEKLWHSNHDSFILDLDSFTWQRIPSPKSSEDDGGR